MHFYALTFSTTVNPFLKTEYATVIRKYEEVRRKGYVRTESLMKQSTRVHDLKWLDGMREFLYLLTSSCEVTFRVRSTTLFLLYYGSVTIR